MDEESDELPTAAPPPPSPGKPDKFTKSRNLMAKSDDSKLATDKPKPSFGDRAASALDRAYSQFSPKAEAATMPRYDASKDIDMSEGSPNRGRTGRGLGESPPEPDLNFNLDHNLAAGQDPGGPRPNESEQERGPGRDLGATPGVYKAKGDPYTYEAAEDGSIWINDGPTGRGMQVKPGSAAYAAILGQIHSGTLTNDTPPMDLGESERE